MFPVWMRRMDKLSGIVPDYLASQGDPVTRQTRTAAFRIHRIDTTLDLKLDGRVHDSIELFLQFAPPRHRLRDLLTNTLLDHSLIAAAQRLLHGSSGRTGA